MNNYKCSLKDHLEIKAISFCEICKIYMCNKCENMHSNLFPHHNSYNIDKDSDEIFTGLCKEKDHLNELKFFCKNHNQLCCAACISKIKGEGNGQHKDCDVCFIKEIQDEKKNNLEKNIKILEELSNNNLEKSINDLKALFEEINKRKEVLKENIQKIFTKIRNELNNREDELLLELDNKFDKEFFKEEIIKESEKLYNKSKKSLENNPILNEEYRDNNKIDILINECINIENNVINIVNINENLQKLNNINNS